MEKKTKLVNACTLCAGNCWNCSYADYCGLWNDTDPDDIPQVYVEEETVDEDCCLLTMVTEVDREHDRMLKVFNALECNLGRYILFNPNAEVETFGFWQEIQDRTKTSEGKIAFVEYLEENWGAWLKDVLSETYELMYMTHVVQDLWFVE